MTPGKSDGGCELIRSSLRRFVGQGETKGCAIIDYALGPDFAPVPQNHSLDRGQADAGAAKLALIVQALEWAKQLGGARHIESGAVVAHEIRSGPVRLRQGPKFSYPITQLLPEGLARFMLRLRRCGYPGRNPWLKQGVEKFSQDETGDGHSP